MSALEMQLKTNEQLRREANVKPALMSDVCKWWIEQCQSTQENDVLVSGFKNPNDNPFKEIKGGCIII
jgi:hypothetical protein